MNVTDLVILVLLKLKYDTAYACKLAFSSCRMSLPLFQVTTLALRQ